MWKLAAIAKLPNTLIFLDLLQAQKEPPVKFVITDIRSVTVDRQFLVCFGPPGSPVISCGFGGRPQQ